MLSARSVAAVGVRRCNHCLVETSKGRPERSEGRHLPMAAAAHPALAIRNLRVDYGDFTAVADLSLTVETGEIFGLVGPNGAGKTSTIRVLATLLEPTYGEVDVAGLDLFEEPEKAHGLIGYMPDLAPVIPDLRVWEFLDLYAHSYGLRGGDKRDRVEECLARVKLSDKRNVYGRGLSRGMTQRVVLAKTLLHEPRLLLLDEPASGMDPIARRDLRRILEELADNGATIIVSSHILSELSDLCTSVGIMHLGRLLRHGPLERVVASIGGEHASIEIEVLEGIDRLAELLAARADVEAVELEATAATFIFNGDRSGRADLLKEILVRGIAVSAFTPSKSGIESLLMELIDER
jgi:ABC-2 type transport system ATP-binding protein